MARNILILEAKQSQNKTRKLVIELSKVDIPRFLNQYPGTLTKLAISKSKIFSSVPFICTKFLQKGETIQG